ncbi:pH-response regulator protein palH/rim21 [Elasticomyces elasticus]|nr:pH-response regulator protein palH/rim21 [Elasticomyces elasticus]KAK5008639.1 hypothetical protein LTR28_003708 [Elasticomyces elasticus]
MRSQDAHRRQLWNLPNADTTSSISPDCTPITLPSDGVIVLGGATTTLTTDAIFTPVCTGIWIGLADVNTASTIADLQEPFYASSIPQTYVIAATTVMGWVLVIMLLITPRTFYNGGAGGGSAFSGGRGIIGGASGGNSSLVGVGSRPWLQKIAALTVGIALSIATADMFTVAKQQYADGYMDATNLRSAVMGSLEIRITRVISDVFLWLAQVQTLIRLFPRHKEKVLIKWIGFALIILDSTFSCLNSFMINTTSKPRHFVDAIPALSYLFELALGLLYAAWVIYYAITKRRYAFYHPKMRNICLVALLSLVAVLTPVVFFITDVSQHNLAGWGDYFRWVGAAAASVVVWEWVERIEALERDEKKDGILGREIFDGDDMLDITPSDELYPPRRQRDKRPRGQRGDTVAHGTTPRESGLMGIAHRLIHPRPVPAQSLAKLTHFPLGGAHSKSTEPCTTASADRSRTSDTAIVWDPALPLAVASPVSRADTTSAASTVYVVRYHPTPDTPRPVDSPPEADRRNIQQPEHNTVAHRSGASINRNRSREAKKPPPSTDKQGKSRQAIANPFKRKRASSPPEIRQARAANTQARMEMATPQPKQHYSGWDIKSRLGAFAADQGEKFRERSNGRRTDVVLPVTIIPAQPRGGRTWSPDTMRVDTSTPQPSAGGNVPQDWEFPSSSSTLQPTGSYTRRPPRNVHTTVVEPPRRTPPFAGFTPSPLRTTASPAPGERDAVSCAEDPNSTAPLVRGSTPPSEHRDDG